MSATFARRHARARERAGGGDELRPVDERQPLLRAQPDRREPHPGERLGPGQPLALHPRLSLADQRQRQVREVAAGADGAAAGDDRQQPAVEALDEQLDRLDAGARVALCERVRAQEHRGTDDLVRVRLPHAARVAPQQPHLQLLGQLLRDRPRDEAAEAGVDPVRVLPLAVRRPHHELACGAHALAGAVGERDGGALDSDRPDVVDAEILTRQGARLDHGGESSSALRAVQEAELVAGATRRSRRS